MSAQESYYSETVCVVAQQLLKEHNDGYDIGTERDWFRYPPIWMERKASRIVSALENADLIVGLIND